MPYITDTQLARVQGVMNKAKDKASKARAKAQEKMGDVIATGEAVGAAAAMGFIRGKMEKDGKQFVIPGTTIDIELLVGLAGVGSAFFDLFGKYDKDVLNMSNGILAHYSGQVFRKFAVSGNFAAVAGVPGIGALGAGDNFDPVSYNPTQFASPYADPVAAALASSGV